MSAVIFLSKNNVSSDIFYLVLFYFWAVLFGLLEVLGH